MLDDKIKITIQDKAGLYYTAVLNADNSYTVGSGVGMKYINTLPKDWDNIPAMFDRNMTYMGVFRGQTKSLVFSKDARAILLDFTYGSGGVNAYALVTVWKFNEATFDYSIFISAEVDFSASEDDKQLHLFNAALLEGGAQQIVKSKSSSNFNIPFWAKDGSVWGTDAAFIAHEGIKLLYNSEFISGATLTNLLQVNGLEYWNGGRHGTATARGVHMLPAMQLYNIVQNNGTTTYIGNDILQPLIPTFSQSGYMIPTGEVNFNDVSKAYTSNNGLIKSLADSITLSVVIKGTFASNFTYETSGTFLFSFVLFEINPDNEPSQTTPGLYDVFAYLYTVTLPPGGLYTPPVDDFISTPVDVVLSPNHIYVLGIIVDNDTSPAAGGATSVYFSDLRLSFKSNYNSGTAAPVGAPIFPSSTIIAYSPFQLWQKLIKSIDSTRTDMYGFPVIVGEYTGVSTYLSTTHDPADDYGLAAQLLMYTSENAVRGIKGIPYLTISLADFFTNWFRMDGLGIGIEGNNIRIEKLEYFFDASTMIVDLGSNISGFKVEPMSDLMFNSVKGGYKTPSTNNDYGVDEFNIPDERDLPLNKTPKVQDLSISGPVVGMYEIEKMRAQRNPTEISNPSSSSACVLMQLSPDAAPNVGVLAPDAAPMIVTPYYLQSYPTAQSTDPTAATAPYVAGLYYPDTAINLNLLPAKNLLRLGRYLASICDQQEAKYLTYRKQYQQNYADPTAPLVNPGIKTNIYGDAVDSVGDILISDFGPQLFRPYLFRFTSGYPANIYDTINTNPYGYIRFVWNSVEFKGFISSVKQIAATGAATEFVLIAHPDTTNAQLKMS